jgi:hypothetical protein
LKVEVDRAVAVAGAEEVEVGVAEEGEVGAQGEGEVEAAWVLPVGAAHCLWGSCLCWRRWTHRCPQLRHATA